MHDRVEEQPRAWCRPREKGSRSRQTLRRCPLPENHQIWPRRTRADWPARYSGVPARLSAGARHQTASPRPSPSQSRAILSKPSSEFLREMVHFLELSRVKSVWLCKSAMVSPRSCPHPSRALAQARSFIRKPIPTRWQSANLAGYGFATLCLDSVFP